MGKFNAWLGATGAFGALSLVLTAPAVAQIKVGVTLSLTGPTAAVILPHQQMWQIMPKEVGSLTGAYTIVDDHGDPTVAVQLVRRLISDDKIDVIMSAGTIPICVAVAQVAAETKTPLICAPPGPSQGDAFKWSFVTSPTPIVVMKPAVDHMKAKGAKTVGFLGFSDSLGDVHLDALKKLSEQDGMKVSVEERFDRTATSITGQALRIISANPDVVFIGASGTPAAFAQKSLVDKGYKGPIYHTNAVQSATFPRAGGKEVQGAYALTSPSTVVTQLDDTNVNKKVALKLKGLWDKAYPGVEQGASPAYSYDAYLWLNAAADAAAKSGQPGTPEFRAALRDQIEQIKDLVGAAAVYNLTPTNHNGTDSRAAIFIQLRGDDWAVVK